MPYQLANYQVLVTDQDEALDFYVNKLGMLVRADVSVPEMGDFRWLVVGPADQPEIGIVLMGVPGEPIVDQETADQLRTLLAKGVGSTVFLTTDDCRAAYEELVARGVEFQEKPEDRIYGVDAGFRDPFGNNFRLTQVREAWGDAAAS
jgi:catechol 2,3-dioxygenase-like lactoylglutathione lyase family enzyme